MPTAAKTKTSNYTNGQQSTDVQPSEERSAGELAMECFREYSQQKPERMALWALGIGFVLGWKLKPW